MAGDFTTSRMGAVVFNTHRGILAVAQNKLTCLKRVGVVKRPDVCPGGAMPLESLCHSSLGNSV